MKSARRASLPYMQSAYLRDGGAPNGSGSSGGVTSEGGAETAAGDMQARMAVFVGLRRLHIGSWADVTATRQEPCRSRAMSSKGEAT